ncbi:hypothetical protein GCM10009722_24080 [Williamsia deligens]
MLSAAATVPMVIVVAFTARGPLCQGSLSGALLERMPGLPVSKRYDPDVSPRSEGQPKLPGQSAETALWGAL